MLVLAHSARRNEYMTFTRVHLSGDHPLDLDPSESRNSGVAAGTLGHHGQSSCRRLTLNDFSVRPGLQIS